MKKRSYFIAILSFLMITGWQATAQEITTYHMHNIWQKHQTNPALWSDCRVYIGLPVISSTNINIEFRGFYVDDVLANLGDLDGVFGDNNTIYTGFSTNMLGFGFKAGKGYFSFDLNQKTNFGLTLPGDFMSLIAQGGNENYIGQTMNFSGLYVGTTTYTELAIGYAYQITDKLRVGARFKLLNGLFDMSLNKFDVGIYTHPVTYQLDIEADIEAGVASSVDPEDLGVELSDNVGYIEIDDIKDQFEVNDFTSAPEDIVNDFFADMKNFGYGFDFGAVYELSDKITLSASVTDFMSKINWEDNVYTVSTTGSFSFQGIDMYPLITGDSDDTQFEELGDSIEASFPLEYNKGSYVTNIGANYYIGGSYEFFDWLNVGALVHGKVYNDIHFASYTFSANAKVSRLLSGTMSYTLQGSGDFNIGAGMAIKLGPAQIYVIADNLKGIYYDVDDQLLWPGNTQNIDIRFGLNILFGCRDKD